MPADQMSLANTDGMFQSAPGREAGRCAEDSGFGWIRTGFNPRPAGRPGDAGRNSAERVAAAVSIRARPGGRAMPACSTAPACASSFQSAPGREAGRCPERVGRPGKKSSFNPRPAGRPGDAETRRYLSPVNLVSIRARPGGRAMRIGRWQPNPDGRVSIRARPGGRAMQPSRSPASTLTRFQSAPGREAGRCLDRHGALEVATGFNPRPAGRPGDASTLIHDERLADCFNPRPAGRPGDARMGCVLHLRQRVSIRARPGGRAMPACRCSWPRMRKFQSAPGREAGRCHAGGDAWTMFHVVSIRARPGGRAMLRAHN